MIALSERDRIGLVMQDYFGKLFGKLLLVMVLGDLLHTNFGRTRKTRKRISDDSVQI
jgi:hypothetical protein